MDDYEININQALILLGEATLKLRLCEDRFKTFQKAATEELAEKNARIHELETHIEALGSELP